MKLANVIQVKSKRENEVHSCNGKDYYIYRENEGDWCEEKIWNKMCSVFRGCAFNTLYLHHESFATMTFTHVKMGKIK